MPRRISMSWTFTLRALFAMVAFAAGLSFYFTYERTAVLRLADRSPPEDVDVLINGVLKKGVYSSLSAEERAKKLKGRAILRSVVGKIADHDRPRPLRGADPDYEWLDQNLMIAADSETNELELSISTRHATTLQLKQLLNEFSNVRVDSYFVQPDSRVDRVSKLFSALGGKIESVLPKLKEDGTRHETFEK
ncbi:hypothetical protein [Mariniblastus fucicola]|uniref:Uncharacterized protein n=1 Tax=Mariniblastus fucicola TaxID=980251 RepID=A0A5B9PDQ6_9BACT|nr:hypothetical protein [Mariniblastus fucicola]QEG22706.1 hypothetical protein MFFC18_25890 [Mariniblastus fucicola]